ncbi:type I-E CRISPR-associated protein Cse1/CasA [Streptomyces sp. NPDC048172]|uniref:type I-E CRISPR-associated protein Cse1/CasA n=1 Tax=Streptomyces sp. NPDC048172 TaxID=3365505 RepID=UPI0037176906
MAGGPHPQARGVARHAPVPGPRARLLSGSWGAAATIRWGQGGGEALPSSARSINAGHTAGSWGGSGITTHSFNLLDEPWLPVVRMDGSTATLGVVETLTQAHHLRALVGETSTVTSALHRLLLAFLSRALGTVDDLRWQELWSAEGEGFPASELEEYAGRWRHRFDLLSSEQPFFQRPELKEAQGTAALVAFRAAKNNATLFDHSRDGEPRPLRPDVAARWLVTVHAYDTAGTKTPVARGSKKSEAPPTTQFGCVLIEGATLFHTLLLNLLEYAPQRNAPTSTTEEDRPAWEAPIASETAPRRAYGWTDLLTWQSRRVRLTQADQDGEVMIQGAVVSPGTCCRSELLEAEHMAAFRAPWFDQPSDSSEVAQRKKTKTSSLRPVRLDALRGVWRHSQELLLPPAQRWFKPRGNKGLGLSMDGFPEISPARLRPSALERIARLTDTGALPSDAVYTLRIFGQEWATGGSGMIGAWHEEAVPAPAALLRAANPRIGRLIGNAVALADDLASVLRSLERRYRQETDESFTRKEESQKEREGFRYESELQFWPQLPGAFAELLRELAALEDGAGGSGGDPRGEIRALWKWRDRVVDGADKAADRWVRRQARTGHTLLRASAHRERYRAHRQLVVKSFEREVVGHTAPPEES